MNELSYYDLHCDTLYERYRTPQKPKMLDRTAPFVHRKQIYAVWSEHDLSPDEAYEQFFQIVQNVPLPPDGYLAIEGGALLGEELGRLDVLAGYGLKYLTLVWRDRCALGGAWNTDEGLTHFGRAVVERLEALGIIPDLSHASDAMFYDTAALTDTFIASHSNSRAVCSHRRNLTDEMFSIIRDAGGLVGISMCPAHLSESGTADIADVLRHIEHYLSLGGEHTVCFGCDFDGIETTPDGISGPADLYRIADAMLRIGYSQSLIDALFYNNANDYFCKKAKEFQS